MICRDTVDIDEIFANDNSGDPYALHDMVNRNPVLIKPPPAPEIAPQRKGASVAKQHPFFRSYRANWVHFACLHSTGRPLTRRV